VTNSVLAVDTIYHARRKANRDFPAEWIRYPQVPGIYGLSSAGKFLGSILANRVRRIHRDFPVSLIHAHAALPCGSAAAYLSRRLGIPFVVTIHGLDVFNSCFRQGLAAGWRFEASLNVYKSARRVICISEKVRRSLTDVIDAEVAAEVVYNGADPSLFAPPLFAPALSAPASPDPVPAEVSTPTILAVGNLLPIKGHELLLRSLVRLKQSHPRLQCRFIGEGSEQEHLARLAKDWGIDDRLQFLGRRSRAEVAEAMRGCTVFALPSRYEGLGCVYLEAMACGRPVIACHGQGIDEVIQHKNNGWLIPVNGLEELTQGLDMLLNDAELRARIGERARQTIVDKFTLSHQAEDLMKIYNEVAQ
jgi:glycosyltransferase involved in cell wall biosynthesis